MIRIHISALAYDHLAATLPEGHAPRKPQEAPQGGFYLWLDKVTRNRLEAAREPGEGHSEAIIRLARIEAAL